MDVLSVLLSSSRNPNLKYIIIRHIHGEGIEPDTTARLEDSKISPEPAASAVLSGV